MKFNKNFIGYEKPSSQLMVQGISYSYNSLGHRCKEIEEIDLDNYILFAGCSHTEGYGLHLNDTYPYLTAKYLKCDYYNLGLHSAGFDILFYNVLNWINKFPKPKLLVIQYPDSSRFSTLESESSLIVPHGPWSTPDYVDLLMKSDDLGLLLFRNYCFRQLLNQYTNNIPMIKLVFGGIKTYDVESIRIEKLDYAVDNLHYGIETHNMCAETIIEQLNI